MSSGRQRGRGGARGGGGGSSRGESSRGRGDGQGRGRGGSDRGDGRGRGRGGPPGVGQSMQMTSRGPPPGSVSGGIYGGPAPAPDSTITASENALIAVTRDQMFDGFPGRRGYGTKGKQIVLRTNYFKLNVADNGETWYRYEVDVQQQLSREKRRRLLEMIMAHARLANKTRATDYASIIFTTERLDLGPSDEWKDTFTLPPPGGIVQTGTQGPAPNHVQQAQARNSYHVRVKYSNSYSLRHIMDYLCSRSGGAEYAGRGDIIQLLNIAMCKPPQSSNSVANVGQNRFYPFGGHPGTESYDLGGALQALRGYYSSVRPAINRLLVNVNVTSGAFYKPIALNNLLLEAGLLNDEKRESFINTLKVNAVYKKDRDTGPPMTKPKTIVGFAKQLNPPTFRVKRFGNAKEVKFKYIDKNVPGAREQEITVFDYFRRERGITLQFPGLPVLNVGTRADPQYIPVEMCTVLPGQPYRNILSGDHTSEMIRFAARFPNLNAMSIAGTQDSPGNGIRLLRLADPPGQPDPQRQSVNPFGFGVNTNMISVPGRILDSPRVTYGNRAMQPQRGAWNLAGQKFATPGRLGKWQALIINRQGPRGNALIDNPQGDMLGPEPLIQLLERELRSYGAAMGQRVPTQRIVLDALTVDNRNSNDRKVRDAYQKAEDQDVRMLFVVLPEADRWLYARIKYYGDIAFGIHSINSVGNKLQKSRGQDQYMGNLALKFNIKGGGVCHKIQNTLSRPLDNQTMLVGIDVTHPSPGSTEGAPSIACVVASTDEHLFQWPGSIRTQTGRQEMVQGLEDMVLERLDLWRRKHNRLPSKIVVYRDGVSEGQYELVLQQEMPPFYDAFKKRYGAQQNWPKVSVIVVGKRHHTRFYPTRVEDADYNPQRQKGSWNPLPGTIVDRGIAGRILREFWLQAHQGLQGTARPAHYVVIKDDIAFEADELEQFTHNMCYLFNRATKAVSICPPAYYADLLCERGRAYLFSTLAENHGSDSSVYSEGAAEWTGGVHQRLKDSTWYI